MVVRHACITWPAIPARPRTPGTSGWLVRIAWAEIGHQIGLVPPRGLCAYHGIATRSLRIRKRLWGGHEEAGRSLPRRIPASLEVRNTARLIAIGPGMESSGGGQDSTRIVECSFGVLKKTSRILGDEGCSLGFAHREDTGTPCIALANQNGRGRGHASLTAPPGFLGMVAEPFTKPKPPKRHRPELMTDLRPGNAHELAADSGREWPRRNARPRGIVTSDDQ